MANSDYWIKGAIKHPGALRAKAKSANAINKKGNIKKDWLSKKAKVKGTTGRQARLAETLSNMNKGKKALLGY